jgi:hypothetical protein
MCSSVSRLLHAAARGVTPLFCQVVASMICEHDVLSGLQRLTFDNATLREMARAQWLEHQKRCRCSCYSAL